MLAMYILQKVYLCAADFNLGYLNKTLFTLTAFDYLILTFKLNRSTKNTIISWKLDFLSFVSMVTAEDTGAVLFRVLAGLKFTSDILSKQPQYCSDIWKFLGHFFRHSFYHHKPKMLSALLIMKPGVVLLPFRTVGAA